MMAAIRDFAGSAAARSVGAADKLLAYKLGSGGCAGAGEVEGAPSPASPASTILSGAPGARDGSPAVAHHAPEDGDAGMGDEVAEGVAASDGGEPHGEPDAPHMPAIERFADEFKGEVTSLSAQVASLLQAQERLVEMARNTAADSEEAAAAAKQRLAYIKSGIESTRGVMQRDY